MSQATITVSNPPRGQGSQSTKSFTIQSMRGSFAWGGSPGQATLVYIGDAPVAVGSNVIIQIAGYRFAGLCISDTVVAGSSGSTRTLQFWDLRHFLTWDWVFCAFNMLERRLVNGVWKKRYWHIYPRDFDTMTKTFTDGPLASWQIVSALFGALTVGSPWSWNLTGNGLFPGGLLNYPVFGFDCLNGKRLDSALNEISEKGGVVYGLDSLPGNDYRLVWMRKGYGILPLWPAASDQRRFGYSLSGNATNIRVLGDRNKYQVMEVPMVKDWAPAWEQFLDIELFARDIFDNEKNPITGKPYNAYPNDVEKWQGEGDAKVRALEITVREYVALRNARTAHDGDQFTDLRKYSNRLRMDMPAALYIQTILWRAFKPDPTWTLVNAQGKSIPPESLSLADELLCRTTYDPVAGTMAADPTQPIDGNGVFIAKGFQLGTDLFRLVQPDRINENFFQTGNKLWTSAQFQIDDSGEQVRFVICDTPVFYSDNLLKTIGSAPATGDPDYRVCVLNAAFTLQVPQTKAALVFEAERFSWWKGTYPNVSRDQVEYVSGLFEEYVGKPGSYSKILYANSQSATDQADVIATSLLLCQYIYFSGGYKLNWNPVNPQSSFATLLSSLVDRVEVELGPNGLIGIVDFTSERLRDNFEPERDLERKTVNNSLYPGQLELRQQSQDQRRLNAVVQQTPQYLFGLFQKLLRGEVDENLHPTKFLEAPTGTLSAGTPIVKAPTAGVATHPTKIDPTSSVFVGVTVRDGEDNTKPFYVQNNGQTYARVKGPVAVNDSIGLADPALKADYLISSSATPVGTAKKAIATTAIQLIPVMLGASGPGSGDPVWLP